MLIYTPEFYISPRGFFWWGAVGWNRTNSSLADHFKSNRKNSRESHATSYDCLGLLALLNYSFFFVVAVMDALYKENIYYL